MPDNPVAPLIEALLKSYRDDEQITLILGSGIGGTVQPRPADMVRLADLGVDALVTDVPDVARVALGQAGSTTDSASGR